MTSFLDVKDGIYDPRKRFAFTNITDEVFNSKWDGSPIVVKSQQTVELPHHLAVKMTREIVDRIMIGAAKVDEEAYKEKHPDAPFYRSVKGMQMGIPEMRKPFEDAVLRELSVDEESPEIQVMRAQIKQELMADLSQEKSTGAPHIPSSLAEFAELGKKTEEAPKPAIKLQEVKVVEAKKGRPKKNETPIA